MITSSKASPSTPEHILIINPDQSLVTGRIEPQTESDLPQRLLKKIHHAAQYKNSALLQEIIQQNIATFTYEDFHIILLISSKYQLWDICDFLLSIDSLPLQKKTDERAKFDLDELRALFKCHVFVHNDQVFLFTHDDQLNENAVVGAGHFMVFHNQIPLIKRFFDLYPNCFDTALKITEEHPYVKTNLFSGLYRTSGFITCPFYDLSPRTIHIPTLLTWALRCPEASLETVEWLSKTENNREAYQQEVRALLQGECIHNSRQYYYCTHKNTAISIALKQTNENKRSLILSSQIPTYRDIKTAVKYKHYNLVPEFIKIIGKEGCYTALSSLTKSIEKSGELTDDARKLLKELLDLANKFSEHCIGNFFSTLVKLNEESLLREILAKVVLHENGEGQNTREYFNAIQLACILDRENLLAIFDAKKPIVNMIDTEGYNLLHRLVIDAQHNRKYQISHFIKACQRFPVLANALPKNHTPFRNCTPFSLSLILHPPAPQVTAGLLLASTDAELLAYFSPENKSRIKNLPILLEHAATSELISAERFDFLLKNPQPEIDHHQAIENALCELAKRENAIDFESKLLSLLKNHPNVKLGKCYSNADDQPVYLYDLAARSGELQRVLIDLVKSHLLKYLNPKISTVNGFFHQVTRHYTWHVHELVHKIEQGQVVKIQELIMEIISMPANGDAYWTELRRNILPSDLLDYINPTLISLAAENRNSF